MFEIRVGELRATFLRNHNMRRHEVPQAEDSPSPGDGRPPSRRHPKPGRQLKHRRPPQPQQPPQARGRCTRYGALYPLRGAAPDMGRCTRTEEVHCLRIGCSTPTNKNKRGTGTPNHSPPHPSMRSWALQVAGWARRPRHHLHSGPLRHPYMRRASKAPARRGRGRVIRSRPRLLSGLWSCQPARTDIRRTKKQD